MWHVSSHCCWLKLFDISLVGWLLDLSIPCTINLGGGWYFSTPIITNTQNPSITSPCNGSWRWLSSRQILERACSWEEGDASTAAVFCARTLGRWLAALLQFHWWMMDTPPPASRDFLQLYKFDGMDFINSEPRQTSPSSGQPAAVVTFHTQLTSNTRNGSDFPVRPDTGFVNRVIHHLTRPSSLTLPLPTPHGYWPNGE